MALELHGLVRTGAVCVLVILLAGCGGLDFLNHQPDVQQVEAAPAPGHAESPAAAPVPTTPAPVAPAAPIAAAAPPPPPTRIKDKLVGDTRVLAGGPTSVAIGPVAKADNKDARRLALAHCKREGRRAMLPRMSGEQIVVYQCAP